MANQRKTLRPMSSAILAGAAAAVLLLSGCASNEAGDSWSDLVGTVDGAGSSAQASAQEVWTAAFQRRNSRVTVNYDPAGSGAGREQFIAGGVSFAGSDAPLNEDELGQDFRGCAPGTTGISLPAYVSPIALVFNVAGVDALSLDAMTAAGIFSNAITMWNDPAIVALNPGADLPETRITAVHRSDSSGTTMNFTDYLAENAPEVWTPAPTDAFPFPGGEAAQGNSGVVNAVANGRNIIGYADASRAGALPAVALQVGEDFVLPTPAAAAGIIDASPLVEGGNPNSLVIDIDRKSTEPGVYPLVLVSYVIACQEYRDSDTAELVSSYLRYVVSPEGQADAAAGAGSAPLSAEFSGRVLAAVDSIR